VENGINVLRLQYYLEEFLEMWQTPLRCRINNEGNMASQCTTLIIAIVNTQLHVSAM
jgi:hypothetical protein